MRVNRATESLKRGFVWRGGDRIGGVFEFGDNFESGAHGKGVNCVTLGDGRSATQIR